MSTRQEAFKRLAAGGRSIPGDPAETVALVVRARRALLLAAHRHRLSREDLEDCYSQATVELLKRAGRDRGFSSRAHIANALEQRFVSRIHDRRRALAGRSPMEAAVASALPLGTWEEGEVEVADARADIERLTLLRYDLRLICRFVGLLSPDQRLLLKSQLAGGLGEDFCREHGWSEAKYRKVGQRARARLAALLAKQNEIDRAQSERSFASSCPALASRSD
ncbi:MAG: hypothetical protein WB998_05285 [Solirubrobacteraceae bacterium]